MAARYISVLGTEYNKTKFGKKWSEIVSSHEAGTRLMGEDEDFVHEVLSRIPRFSRRLAQKNVRFHVVNKVFNGKMVKGIVAMAGESRYEAWVGKQRVMDYLFPRSTEPDPFRENRRNALKAMRSAIEPQIQQYRSRFAGQSVIKSSLTGKPIFGPYHVDHVFPFIRLVEEWCRENGYDLETIPVKCRSASCRLESVDMSESWFDYHAFHAEFQILDASENTSKGSKYFGRSEDPIE